jgi:hypothetical protein
MESSHVGDCSGSPNLNKTIEAFDIGCIGYCCVLQLTHSLPTHIDRTPRSIGLPGAMRGAAAGSSCSRRISISIVG